MSETTAGRWIRLRDGDSFVDNLRSGFDERQKLELLVSALLSRTVPMRARFAAKPRHPDGQPVLPELERDGVLGMTTPLPNIQVFLRMDPRLVTWDIRAGRIVISPIWDDKRFWGGFDWNPTSPAGQQLRRADFSVLN
jgi:hypothetical protein